jgi:hypothetical protein
MTRACCCNPVTLDLDDADHDAPPQYPGSSGRLFAT